MNDIVIAHIHEPHQTVVVLAGNGYVALECYFSDRGPCGGSRMPDEVVLLGIAAGERLAHALISATRKSGESS